MALYLVLLSTILAFSLTSTEQYVLSPGSNIDLSLDSMKNASGNWNITFDTMKKNPQLLSENVHQGTSSKTEQLDSHPSLHDTLMSGAVQPTAASTTTTTTPKSCPQSGYQLFPGFNCYKAFPSLDDTRNWTEARVQCIRDGGDLMVIESEKERTDVFVPLSEGLFDPPWVGVYIPLGRDAWMSVKGDPALSAWWELGYPVNAAGRNCALAFSTGQLRNYECTLDQTFICEISI